MRNKLLTSALAACTLASGVVLQAQPALSASIRRCASSIEAKVSLLDPNPGLVLPGAIGTCNVGTTNNDSQSQVNADLMFGKADWRFKAKDEGNLGDNLGFANGTSGTWNIATQVPQLTSFTDLMLVLKGSAPNSYVGYLIDSTTISGEWSTPFFNSKGNPQDVSHLSLYYRNPEDGVAIPTPALLPGLVGMGVAAFRKRKQAEEGQEA